MKAWFWASVAVAGFVGVVWNEFWGSGEGATLCAAAIGIAAFNAGLEADSG